MLTYLNIKNFALIENCEIEFSSGLNIISGETGAGKSIMIQALSILLGGRASTEQIRTGMEEAVLNATIEIKNKPDLIAFLKESGISVEDDEVLIRRVLTSNGKSRSFINGIQVTSKELEILSAFLFDFHGQHEGISLLKKNTHLKYLDDFLNNGNDLKLLNNVYQELKNTENALQIIENSDKDKEKRIELLKYEIEEIESTSIKDNEDEILKKEIKILENSEKLINSLEEAHKNFSGSDGILAKLRNNKNLLTQISEMDQYFSEKSNDVSDIYYKLEDISEEIVSKMDKYQVDPGKLDKLIERSEVIEKLKRKYNGTIESIREYLKKSKEELDLINFSSEKKEKLSKYLTELKNKYLNLSINISKKRREGALSLENKVKNELIHLGMEKVEFKVKIDLEESETDFIILNNKKIKYKQNGIDDVEFLISPNKGEPLKSLIKIASGGELSRIIISLKTVLAEKDSIETMIFDEIDTGIGGKVALSVGKSLKNLSAKKQLICITHLAQIAASGEKNFLIQKNVINSRTVTSIDSLNENDKIKEIARMLSGQITEVSLNHAKEVIESLKN
jgi:DNA repair protein RecN (Recombination protein N)